MAEDEVKKLEQKNSVLEQKLALYENDPTKRGYFSLVRIVNQQVDILNGFNLKSEIGSNPKEDKQYDRVKSLWEGLKAMIIDLKALKIELRISPEDEVSNKVKEDRRTTPESIADSIGNTAGQNM